MPVGTGTLINFLLVLLGSYLGIKFGSFIPNRVREAIVHAVALFTILLGIHLIIDHKAQMIKVFSLLMVGTFLGYSLRLEERLETLVSNSKNFVGAFVTASAIFSIGPMTLMGCILEATKGDSSLLISKGFMDGITSVFLASLMGKGVMASSIFVLLYQGSITALAYFFGEFLNQSSLSNAMFIGGGILIVIGFQMLGMMKEIKTLNIFPAFLIAIFV